jgi:MinD-like ATPase involved in chromosome partitioning or flagellar assembly
LRRVRRSGETANGPQPVEEAPAREDAGWEEGDRPEARLWGPRFGGAARPMRREDVYRRPLVAGRERRENPVTRLYDRLRELLRGPLEREEIEADAQLGAVPPMTRTNIVAVISPKGGVGKTTSSFLVGNLLASRLKIRTVAVDANPDFGTLAALAPEAARADLSLADLLRDREQLDSLAVLRRYVSPMPTGLHLLAAPAQAEAMAEMSTERYDELIDLLGRFYELIVLDCGTGITDPLAQFAVSRADQTVVVTTPEWITASNVLGALKHLRLERATLVLNQAHRRHTGDREVIEAHFRQQRLGKRVEIPYDERLRTMLDSGTYAIEGLERATRLPVKRLGLAVAGQLV